jgi:CBS domain-containing protein
MHISQFKKQTIEESDLTRPNVPSLPADRTAEEAITLLAKEPHFLIVTTPEKTSDTTSDSKKECIGILSTSDLEKLNNLKSDNYKLNERVHGFNFDKDKIVSVKPTDTLEHLSRRMKTSGHKVLPVITEQGELEGIVTSSDLLKRVRRDVQIQI